MAHATKGSFPQLAVVFATCSICDKGSQRRFAAMGPNDGRADKAVIDHVGEDPVLSNGSTPSRKSLQSKNGQGGEPTRFAVDVCLSLREVKRVELVTRKKSQSSKSTTDNLAKRMPADKRRMSMLDDAAVHFAEHGFAATTRDIAGALGVTQALIYKHFDSKEDLVERTLERAFTADADSGPWIDEKCPLDEELLRFYRGFVGRSSEMRMKLFIRAGLDGRSWPTRRGHKLNSGLFLPTIAALRSRAGLPDFDASPAMRGERELVMTLHASMVFLGIRRHVYGMVMAENLDDVVGLYVSNFLAGADTTIIALHNGGEETLTIPIARSPN